MRPAPSRLALVAAGLALAVAAGCAPRRVVEERVVELRLDAPAAADTAAVAAEITAALMTQRDAWNAGDLRAFMDLYLRTRQTTFLSGGSVRQGWQDTFYAYQRAYPDRAAMGTLAFTDLVVRPLGPETALAWGRWRLTRDADTPGGLFTLLFQKHGGAWRIVHDHTSSESP